jgi:hypothetical protein
MKLGNNDMKAKWIVLVYAKNRSPRRYKFYGGYATAEEATAVRDDRNADQGTDGEFYYVVAGGPLNTYRGQPT